MAGREIWGILALLLLTTSAAAIEFQVGVEKDAEAIVRSTYHDNISEDFHTFNTTVDNPSSVGCRYSLRGYFKRNDTTEIVNSGSYGIWPGDTKDLELSYFPKNYTGEVQAEIQLSYCGINRSISRYSFNVTERTVIENNVRSETLQANRSQAKIELAAENGYMVPINTPDFWKVKKAKINNNTADLEYFSSLYKPKEVEYAVLGPNETIIGKTTVDTTPPDPSWRDKVEANFWMILAGLLIVSILINLYLLRNRIVPDIVREKLAELELEGRDIRNN